MSCEDIVRALRCVSNPCESPRPCQKCKYYSKAVGCEAYQIGPDAADAIERLSGEVEDLRRTIAMSDKDVTAAHLHFSQWQAAFNQLTQTVSRIEDEDKSGELCAAIRAQLAAWGKAMEGTA